jgi:type I restriction enzyme M protein
LFYAQGVKANVLFFEKQARQRDPVDEAAVDLRPAHQQALHAQDQPAHARRLERVRAAVQPGQPQPPPTSAKPTWSAENPDGRWRAYSYDELVARDKASLDIFWLKDDRQPDR